MTGITMRHCSSWALLSLLAINLALIAGCSGTTPTQGSNCYAKALPTAGTGGLAWGSSPVAGVTPQLADEHRLLADLAWSRRHGFGAKLCIHPRQVAPIHAALAPSAQSVDWARRVLAAEAASPGAAQLDGRMIDRPVVLQAQRTLHRAGGA